jgi:hypothetical protein
MAPENPGVVEEMQAKIAAMIKTFPAEVQQAYEATQKRKANPITPTGANPYPIRM